jgi:hypothetical protein
VYTVLRQALFQRSLAREDFDKVNTGDLNFHDNRGAAATLLAEAGATAPEIAEALCWSVDKAQRVIDYYLARRGLLAANAIRKLEDHRDKRRSAINGDQAKIESSRSESRTVILPKF